MTARLVQIEAGRRVGATSITRELLTIGRDPVCDVVLDTARVSRRHACIQAADGGHTLTDLGSANGTLLNGHPVLDTLRLESGDRIELAGEVTLLYQSGTGWTRPGLALSAVLTLALVGVWLVLRGPDPLLEQAAERARLAVEADARGDYAAAKQGLQSAVGLLFRDGRLDDVPRQDVMRVGLQRIGERLEGAPDLDALFERALTRSRPSAPQPDPAQEECRLDEMAAHDLGDCIRRRVRHVLTALRQDPNDVPATFYAEVGRRVRLERDFLEKALPRGDRYRAMMERELAQANMPPILYYLSAIESGYRLRARSPAGAAGLWQIMPATARQYGLSVEEGRDERYDAEKSTRAAARYLRDLAFEFGGNALLLALASYNRGENAVRRSLKRLDDPFDDRSYWALVQARHLPQETANYVTRFMAAAVVGEAGLPSEDVLRAAGY